MIFGGVCHWQADPRLAVGGLRSSAASHIQARDVILGRFGGPQARERLRFFMGCLYGCLICREWWRIHAKTGGMLEIEKGKVRF